MLRAGICCVAALSLALFTGCGSSLVTVKLVPVEGTLKLNGKPLANKSIMFTPDSGSGVSAGGISDANGKFTLKATIQGATSDQNGCPPGTYKVVVFEPLIEVNMKDAPAGAEPMLVPDSKKSEIPRVYLDAATTTLKATVPEAGGTVDLDLKG